MKNLAIKFVILMSLLGFISPEKNASISDRWISTFYGGFVASVTLVIFKI
jgi:hypothetical protein